MKKMICIGKHLAMMLLVSALAATGALAETCSSGSDMDSGAKSALEGTAQRFYDMASRGDVASLRQNAISSLASDFGGVESAVVGNRPALSASQGTVRASYLLNAPGNAPLARAEFFCGIFNSPDRTGFVINGLPPGQYAIVIMDAKPGDPKNGPVTLSLILQQQGGWKLAGYYVRPTQAAGHDGNWYLNQAKAYKAKGENHNAWFYYLEARDLLAPLPFMSTPQLDQIYDEAQSVRPSDMPPNGSLTLQADGRSATVSEIFPVVGTTSLDLVVKYKVASIADTAQTFAGNMAVIKALVARYPELRSAFSAVAARAVAPSGEDYGSLLAMKDVK